MKKFLLALTVAAATMAPAGAVAWLPAATVTGETVNDGNVTITWDYDGTENPCDHFQVIVYRKHKATAAENFVLAQSDFAGIESTGTMTKAENRGAIWDYVPECPGWWVKYPMYMNGAMGIDAFFYFAGSDNADIFGGSYMVSPDYDLSGVSGGALKMEARLAAEAISVSGGFAMWAWNTNWFDPANIDYKPVYNCDFHYSNLSTRTWTDVSETMTFPRLEDFSDPEQLDEIRGIDRSRTRVMFYGSGYSSYWIDGFKLSVDLAAGDVVDYGAEIIAVDGNTATINTAGDTENDFVYAYEIRPVKMDYDENRRVTTVRFVDYAYSTPRHVIGQFSGVENITGGADAARIYVRDGKIVCEGASDARVEVFTLSGRPVYSGVYTRPIELGSGMYVVKAGATVAKVVL